MLTETYIQYPYFKFVECLFFHVVDTLKFSVSHILLTPCLENRTI